MRVVILNDTAKHRKDGEVYHFGCHLVMDSFEEQLHKVGIELVTTYKTQQRKFKIPDNIDLVLVNGEGTLHDGRAAWLLDIANHYPTALINTSWYNNPPYDSLRRFKYIAVRESMSKEAMPSFVQDSVEVVPDVIFSSSLLSKYGYKTPRKAYGATDSVFDSKARGDVISSIQRPETFLEAITQYRGICTGRFHGAAVCASLGIPFSAYPSNTHKIESMMRDIGVEYNHYPTKEEACSNIPKESEQAIQEYVTKARERISLMFEKLWEKV